MQEVAGASGYGMTDGDWKSKDGNDNFMQQNYGAVIPQNMQSTDLVLATGENFGRHAIISGDIRGANNFSNFLKGSSSKNPGIGLQEHDELNGLLFEERKRQRSESSIGFDNNKGGLPLNTKSTFSGLDYSESSPQFLATLAQ